MGEELQLAPCEEEVAAAAEEPPAGTTTAVRVAVRVRPLVAKERLEQCRGCLRAYPKQKQIVIGKDRGFTFDFVFGEEGTQDQIYDEACAPLVERCFDGYNATIFAYGQTGAHACFRLQLFFATELLRQTELRQAESGRSAASYPNAVRAHAGSGKTFTMGSGSTIGLASQKQGIVPRAVNQIFSMLEVRVRALA